MISNKSKILFIVPSMRGGGSERVMSILLANLSSSRFDITLALVKKEGRYLDDLPQNLRIIDLNSNKTRYAFFKIIKLIFKEKPDVVFSTLSYLNLLIAIIRPFFSKRIKFIARETNTVSVKNQCQPYSKLFDWLYKKVYNNFDLIVSQAEYMKNDLIENYSIDENKIKVINNPIDFIKIDKLSSIDKEVFNKKINLLAVGSFSNQKGFDLLLNSINKLELDFELTILGEGKEKVKIEKLAEQLNLNSKVKLLGFQDNPYIYMKQADLFILSSRYEGFPNVVLEANACGTLVVAFECPGGTAEIIENGKNGFLVPCQDIDKLSQKINKAINFQFDKEKIIKNTKLRYGVEVIVKKYEDIFC